MKRLIALMLILHLLLLAACLPTPPPELLITNTPHSSSTYPSENQEDVTPSSTTMPIEIGNRTVDVNEVIHGFLCDDSWRGVIYVEADVEVHPWSDEATFLRQCNLEIAQGTVVYVADHPGEVFYKGCSCHE
ncbi:MAG: hypothetical protein PVI78_13155 [Anaerolineales bacterium]|jgi:hypothetical protein